MIHFNQPYHPVVTQRNTTKPRPTQGMQPHALRWRSTGWTIAIFTGRTATGCEAPHSLSLPPCAPWTAFQAGFAVGAGGGSALSARRIIPGSRARIDSLAPPRPRIRLLLRPAQTICPRGKTRQGPCPAGGIHPARQPLRCRMGGACPSPETCAAIRIALLETGSRHLRRDCPASRGGSRYNSIP